MSDRAPYSRVDTERYFFGVCWKKVTEYDARAHRDPD